VTDIGWIGVGMVGEPMALRLLAAGHRITACARSGVSPRIEAAGGAITTDARDTVASRDVVGVCVYDDDQLLELVESGVFAAVRSDALVLIHTTGIPEVLSAVHAAMPPGVALLDATFSGSGTEAASGTLVILAGGPANALGRAEPILRCYANEIIHVGGLGDARRLKLVNNALYAANLSLAIDALRATAAAGIEETAALRGLACCSGASRALQRIAQLGSPDELLEIASPYLKKDLDACRTLGVDLGEVGRLAATVAAPGASMSSAPNRHETE